MSNPAVSFACSLNLTLAQICLQFLLNPIVNERGSSLVSLCCLVQLLQLSLENLDMLTLIFDLGGIGFAIRLNDVIESKLGLHIDLSATPFATRFQYVDTSSLGGC